MNLLFGTSILLLLIIIELVLLAKMEEKELPWQEIITNVNSGHVMLWLARAFAVIIYDHIYSHYSWNLLVEIPRIVTGVLVFIIWDFCYYWSHRTHHSIPFLWNIHSVHHQGEHFNLSLGIRNSWYQPLTSIPFYIGLAIIGVSVELYVLVSGIHYSIQFYNHNAIVEKSGFLEKILITPSHHRVHHGKNPEYINKNHGGTFVFWDKIFGTFQSERDDIKIQFGLRNGMNPKNPLWVNTLPFLKYYNISLKNRRKAARSKAVDFQDTYLVIGSFLLFLLLLTYIQHEATLSIALSIYLFLLLFLGTIALGGVMEENRLGLPGWILLSIPGSCILLMYYPHSDPKIQLLIVTIIFHGLYGLFRLTKLLPKVVIVIDKGNR